MVALGTGKPPDSKHLCHACGSGSLAAHSLVFAAWLLIWGGFLQCPCPGPTLHSFDGVSVGPGKGYRLQRGGSVAIHWVKSSPTWRGPWRDAKPRSAVSVGEVPDT